MMFIRNKIKPPALIIHATLLVLFCFAPVLSAQPQLSQLKSAAVSFVITPGQCVAIVQGDDCYVDVKISWQSQQAADYCLYSSQQSEALQCWHKRRQGELSKEFIINENTKLYLKYRSSKQVLAQGLIEMSWVYKKNGRSRASWRMF